jgi:hypothetical protein
VPIACAAALLVHVVVLQGFPNSGDEYAYLWQASAFADGTVTAPSPQPAEAFKLNHIGDSNGRRFCKYSPGWPLLLAGGVRAGIPWIVNPLLAALALAGIYRLGCSWISPRAALAGVALVGTSPFFLLNAASYFNHPSCLFALTAMALGLTWCEERPGGPGAAVAGAAWGLAVLIRPFTALLIGVPLIVAFARRWKLRNVILFGAGGLPLAVVLLLINSRVTGSMTTLPWTQFDATERLGFGVYGHTPLRGLRIAIKLLAEGTITTGFMAPLLAALTLGRPVPRRWLLWTTATAIVVGYCFWWSDGGNRYGPRFYFEALLPFTLLVGAGFDSLRDARLRRGAMLIAVMAMIVVSVRYDTFVYRQIYARRDLYRTVQAAGLHDATVFLQTASADMVRIDLTRNPPAFDDATVLYALSLPGVDDEVRRTFPRRKAYWYRWRPAGGILSLSPEG